MAKSILITGANGQLGNEIQLLRAQYPAFDFFFTDIDTLDLTDKNAVERFVLDNHIDYIINCAAYTAVDKAEDEAELCYKINSGAVANLAEAANIGKAKVIHVSTDYVFPGTGSEPLKETDATSPQSVYGKSKLEGEQRLMTIHPESIIIRTAWLYSTFGNNFVKTMIRLGSEKDSINVVSDQYGTPTYAADLASAIMHIVDYSEGNTIMPGIYHYSNEGKTNWAGFAAKIMELKKLNCKVNPIPTSAYPTKAARPQYSLLDKTKIKQTFNLHIPQWEDSLEKCINKL